MSGLSSLLIRSFSESNYNVVSMRSAVATASFYLPWPSGLQLIHHAPTLSDRVPDKCGAAPEQQKLQAARRAQPEVMGPLPTLLGPSRCDPAKTRRKTHGNALGVGIVVRVV